MTHAIITQQKASTIVENVLQAQADAVRGLELLCAAKTRLRQTLGEGYPRYYDTILADRLYDGDLTNAKLGDTVARRIEENAWRYLIELMGLREYMTETRRNELEQQFKSGTLPPLSVDNLLSTFTTLASQTDTLLAESIIEVFDWLRPQHKWGAGALKTNNKFLVGKKVIVSALSTWAGRTKVGFTICSYQDTNLRALGNVFSLLDGQGVLHYSEDFVTRLSEGLRKGQQGQVCLDDAYFHIKPYCNGNLHIDFKRLDLVDKLNQIGSDGVSLREGQ